MRSYHLGLVMLAACGGAGAQGDDAITPPPPPPASVAGNPPPGAPQPPNAAPPVCDVRKYGAKGDGTTKDTKAIQSAIDACADKGGTVKLSGGTFSSGMIQLKSNMTLFIDPTATLRGTQDDADYPTTNPPTTNTQLLNCRKALVYAESAHDVHITGGGTIDGNGNKASWLGGSKASPEATRPMAIYTALSKNVTIDNISVKDAAMWGVVNLEVDNLVIRNVNVDTPLSGNRDGIDVVDGSNVLIENVTIRSEDDSICLKSGARRGLDNVTVRGSHVKQSIVANGLKFGTASYGKLQHVVFEDIVVENVDKAAMAIESVDGADISDVTFRRITVHGAGTPIFILAGDRGSTPSNDVHKLGTIDGVHFENITADGMKYNWSSPISGMPNQRLKNLTFTNVALHNKGGLTSVPADPPEYKGQYPDPNLWGNMPAFGYFVRHADGVTFQGVTTDVAPTDARTWLVQRDVTNLVVK
jgi:polygalacturonase